MKAVTLHQPWASLVATGQKTYETRPWATRHRGWIAIHAAKTLPLYAVDLLRRECEAGHVNNVPFGAIVGLARIADVHYTVEVVDRISARERELGDYAAGRHAWALPDHLPLQHAVPCVGHQRIWEVPADVAGRVLTEALAGRDVSATVYNELQRLIA